MPKDIPTTFERWLKTQDPAMIGAMLLDYVAESNHQGWEFPRQSMTGIRALFVDFQLYVDTVLAPGETT